jgi:hypothetical protein
MANSGDWTCGNVLSARAGWQGKNPKRIAIARDQISNREIEMTSMRKCRHANLGKARWCDSENARLP